MYFIYFEYLLFLERHFELRFLESGTSAPLSDRFYPLKVIERSRNALEGVSESGTSDYGFGVEMPFLGFRITVSDVGRFGSAQRPNFPKRSLSGVSQKGH
jgi:hypothetical protein